METMMTTQPDDFVLDLDADRARRQAEREATAKPMQIRIDGEVVSTLPEEFPLAVLEPLRRIDQDLALLLRQAFQMQQSDDPMGAVRLVIDLLVQNPNLPSTLLDVARDMAAELLGEKGLEAVLASRPSGPDLGFLFAGVTRYYGFSLGESSESSDSQEADGSTSKPTSVASTESTSEGSTKRRGKKAS